MVAKTGPIGRFWQRRGRLARGGLLVLATLLGIMTVALATSPWWLTPVLQTERPALERALTRAMGGPVQVQALAARVGWRVGFVARGITITGRRGPAVILTRARIALSWLALWRGRLWPAYVGVRGARLNLRATRQGLKVVGLPHRAGPALDWRALLLRLHGLHLSHADLSIALTRQRMVSLQGLAARWTVGLKGRTLRVRAHVPGICARCAGTVDWSGTHWSARRFRGGLGFAVAGLDLHAAAALAASPAWQPLAGEADGHLWTTWRRGRLGFVGGRVQLSHVRVPPTSRTRALAVAALSGRFSLKLDRHRFRFYAADLVSAMAGSRSEAGSVFVGRTGGRWRLAIDRLRLGQVGYVARRLRSLPPGLTRLAALRPVGRLTHLHLQARPGPHWHYTARGYFAGLGLGQPAAGPYFAHAAGSFSLATRHGQLLITGLRGMVRGPARVPGPLVVRSLHAQVLWQNDPTGFSFELPSLALVSRVGTMQMAASGVKPLGHPLTVLLAARLAQVRVQALQSLYPRGLKNHLHRWLARTVQGGLITRGRVTLKGPLDDFPFRDGRGLFHVTLHVVHGRYHFLPDWPSARALAVVVRARNAELRVKGSGTVGGVPVSRLSVRAGPLGTPGGVASVTAVAKGPLGGLLRLVLPHVGRRLRRTLPPTIKGHGSAHLTLHLHIPFSHSQAGLRLAGHLGLAQARLSYPFAHTWLVWQGLTGTIGFTDHGPDSGQMDGRLLGGPFALRLEPGKDGTVEAHARGAMAAAYIRHLLGRFRGYVRGGPLGWRLRVHEGPYDLRALADLNLKAVALSLPYPAGKRAGVPATARLVLASGPHGIRAGATMGQHLALRYARTVGPPRLWLGIGSAMPPRRLSPGLAVGVRSGYFAVAPWLRFVKALPKGSRSASVHAGFAPRSVSAYVGSLRWGGRLLGTVHARFRRVKTAWEGVLEGPDIAGTVSWQTAPRRTLIVRLDHLTVPRATGAHGAPRPIHLGDPRRLPALRFVANTLSVDGHYVGRVVVDGAPYPDGFRFGRIWLVRPHAEVTGSGQWTIHGGIPQSLFALTFHSQNLGRTLSAWGVPHQVAGGRMSAHGALNWPGSPAAFALDHLEANVGFLVRHGRFIQVNEGAGKLLGILNVDSLFRYLTLDFSNIFGRGFAFERIAGKLIAEGGVAKTPGIHIQGASADVLVSGQASLTAKTFDLKVKVHPHIQNNVTLATGLIGGPIAGAAVLLMQKIFAREINQGTGLTYYIKGPWNKPSIQKKTDKD